MSLIWEVTEMEGKNPSHTGAFFHAHDPGDFSTAEVVARESAQNAIDAGRDVSRITELEFHEVCVSGAEKSRFVKLFKFEELLKSRMEVFSKNRVDQYFSENLQKFMDGDKISALLIRDFNTCGLGGAWDKHNVNDHFGRLVCNLSVADKADDDPNSGGSFGLGKTTYAKSSQIKTVLYHSTFEPTVESLDVNRRLMITGIYPKHRVGEKEYGGFAYFGESEKDKGTSAKPIEDESAKEMWNEVESLFRVRTSREDSRFGTDVLILMSELNMGDIVKAIEDYYFPAVINGDISVKFFQRNSEPTIPNPKSREDLSQYIRLYDDATTNENESSETKLVKAFPKYKRLRLGRYAFQLADQDKTSSDKFHHIALMRGTGMVLNYAKIGSDRFEPAVGVFIANENVRPYLVKSENPAHSNWSQNSYRLQQAYPDDGKLVVHKLNTSIKSEFRRFQKSLQPDVLTPRNEGGMFSRFLAAALTGGSGDKPPPPGLPNLVSISLTHSSRNSKRSSWKLVIAPNEHTPSKPFSIKLVLSISIAGDSKNVAIKHKEFVVKDSKGKLLKSPRGKLEISNKFSHKSKMRFTVEFANPGNQNYVLQCKCVTLTESSS